MSEIHISTWERPEVLACFAELLTKLAALPAVPVECYPTDQPPIPVEQAPVPAAAAPVPAPVAPVYDKAGIPWDERIHSGSRAINTDGTWKKRRGVSEDTVKQVTAELIQPSGFTGGEIQEQLELTQAPDLNEARAVFGTPPAPTTINWAEVISRIAKAKGTGAIDDASISTVLAAHNIANLALLAGRPDAHQSVLGQLGLL